VAALTDVGGVDELQNWAAGADAAEVGVGGHAEQAVGGGGAVAAEAGLVAGDARGADKGVVRGAAGADGRGGAVCAGQAAGQAGAAAQEVVWCADAGAAVYDHRYITRQADIRFLCTCQTLPGATLTVHITIQILPIRTVTPPHPQLQRTVTARTGKRLPITCITSLLTILTPNPIKILTSTTGHSLALSKNISFSCVTFADIRVEDEAFGRVAGRTA
jgi:hypothetical protein